MKLKERIGRHVGLRGLNIFLAVAKERSMSRAAERLAISQPVVSKAIAELEKALGVPLFDRDTRAVEPTLYGQALINRGVAVFDELRRSVTDIESLLDPTVGEVRIGGTTPLSAGIVPAVIERLSLQHPRLSFYTVEGDIDPLQQELRDRNIEVAIGRALAPISDHDMESQVLFDDQLLVVAGSQSKWAQRRKIKLTDLLQEPWALPVPGGMAASVIADTFRAAHLEVPRATVSTTSMSVNFHLLATGRFLALLPATTVRISARHLPLKALPVDLPARSRPIVLITLKKRTLSPATKLFIECARDIARTA